MVIQDVTLWVVCANTVITGLCFAIIKFNDLKHLSIKVSDIGKDVKGNTKKLNRIDKKVAVSEKAIAILESEKKK